MLVVRNPTRQQLNENIASGQTEQSIRDAVRAERDRLVILDALVDTLELNPEEATIDVVIRERDRCADHLKNLIALVEGECAFTGEPVDV